jgi:hypothetical protein
MVELTRSDACAIVTASGLHISARTILAQILMMVPLRMSGSPEPLIQSIPVVIVDYPARGISATTSPAAAPHADAATHSGRGLARLITLRR